MTPKPVQEIAPTVLVVERDQQLRRLIGRILDAAGYRVLEAGSHTRAMQLLEAENHSVDVMVMDSLYPSWQIEDGRKVLLLSFDPDASQAGGILPKPFKPSALLEAVGKILR